jgi:predicted ATPase
MTVVAATGLQSQKAQNYYVVTQLLEVITGVEKDAGDLGSRSPEGPGGYRALLADWIRNHVSVPEVGGYPLQEVLSLLNDVVDAGFPDHETVLGLRVDERQQLQAELLCTILRNSLESQPTVLIVDDLQWVDAQSLLVSLFVSNK